MVETNGCSPCQQKISLDYIEQLTIWNCRGTTLKLRICTAGQSKKFAFREGRYTSWNFRATARRPPPSVTVMNVKKAARPVLLIISGLSLNPVARPTNRGKDELVKAYSLQCWHCSTLFRDWECSGKKGEPLEL